ncbi:NAD(P)-dependent dehydrogenase (short-subunit alcohol dehydrogenase family) [Neisseria perflava]|nr:NAD(P)-dependent dehydrogenase (short-subunit alcohol dehydrogenase family) [Neisseria perflava]MCP1773256.1 NAD(P)-dependent dehydrogenase (short-subunit alcohol dehydrogenase family) [Neisseria perflava]
MKALVIGTNGRVGVALVGKLVALGYQVYAAARCCQSDRQPFLSANR